jgi:hypothetical protein
MCGFLNAASRKMQSAMGMEINDDLEEVCDGEESQGSQSGCFADQREGRQDTLSVARAPRSESVCMWRHAISACTT